MRLVKPKKALGQHFLKDLQIAQRIADTLDTFKSLPVLEIGPGMGVSEKKYQLIEEILSIFDGPVVIDADGITNLCRFGKKTGILKKKDNT